MTVIAAYKYLGLPFLFGDLLTSGAGATPRQIPSIGHTDAIGDGWKISGLQQKTVLISPKCALAWAGDWSTARAVVARLRKLTNSSELDAKSLIKAIDEVLESSTKRTYIVGWLIHEDTLSQFMEGAQSVAVPTLGKLLVAGTGMFGFIDAANHVFPGIDAGVTGPNNKAWIHWAMMAGGLLGAEQSWGKDAKSLGRRFGGGYELVFRGEHGFEKLGDVTLIFWSAMIDETGAYTIDGKYIYKQHYEKSTLIIRTATANDEMTPSELHPAPCFVVSPMYEVDRVAPEVALAVPLQSMRLCHVISMFVNESFAGHIFHCDRGDHLSAVSIEEDGPGRNVRIVVSPRFTETIDTKILDFFAGLPR